jgi:hypothetical protein
MASGRPNQMIPATTVATRIRQERLSAMKARHAAPAPTRPIGSYPVTYDVVARSPTNCRGEPISATGGYPCHLQKQKTCVGPMSTQTSQNLTICAALPLMPTAGGHCDTSTIRKQTNRNDAVLAAKAEISRRRSLKKQREEQTAHLYFRESSSR